MIRLLPWVATIVARTLRIRVHGAMPDRCVVAFWHGKMFAGWYACRQRGKRGSKPVALISASKDGDILTNVVRHWGYAVERGSSSKSGLEALGRAVARVRNRECDRVVITPDGPRGPHHRLKRGAFLAAQELQLPICFLRIRYQKAKTLNKSWDRFEIPLPFSTIEITIEMLDARDFPPTMAEQHEWLNEKAARLQL